MAARWIYPLLTLLIVAVYAPTLSTHLTISDGPEIVTAVVALGVIHPSGYPLFTIVAHAFVWGLPKMLAPCVRIEVMNAFAGAGAALFTALATRRLARRLLDATELVSDAAGALAGVMLALAPLVWGQVRIPEVYATHLFLVSWASWALCHHALDPRGRWLVHAAVPMGLGLAHHATILYLIAAAILVVILHTPSRISPRSLGLAVVFLVLPLGSYAYLFWSTTHSTSVVWGAPGDADTFVRHVTAQQYRHLLGGVTTGVFRTRLLELPGVLVSQLFFPGVALFFVGVVALARRSWRLVVFLVVLALENVVHGLIYAVPDYDRYFIPALVPTSSFAGLGLAALLGRWSSSTTRPVVAALVAIAMQGALATRQGLALGDDDVTTDSFGAEVTALAPPGSILITLGDGIVSTLRYEAHVMGRGLDVATIDAANAQTWWHRQYLESRFPASCDPLAHKSLADREDYERRCGTFARRTSVSSIASWISFADDPPSSSDTDVRRHDVGGRGSADTSLAAEAENVPGSRLETTLHRLIVDHIDERPVLERNAFTHRGGAGGWTGPTFHRVSGEFALVNRGLFNQILYADDVTRDTCASDQITPLARRPLSPARLRPHAPDRRRPYRPNDIPTLLATTFLTSVSTAHEDAAMRQFRAGDAIHMHLDWLERESRDPSAPGQRGLSIHREVHVCVFDSEGHKVSSLTLVSGESDTVRLLAPQDTTRGGVYTVEACMLGEPAGQEPSLRACQRGILEYSFEIDAR